MPLNIPTYKKDPFTCHRSGWPPVLAALRKRAITGRSDNWGIPFDDFVDASHTYRRCPYQRKRPWVGIFHHPATLDSPLERDQDSQVRRTLENKSGTWASCPPPLGILGLSQDLAEYVGNWLDVPQLALWHPTDLNVPLWRADDYFARPRIMQLGHYLRDTRVIFRLPPKMGTEYFRSIPTLPWQIERDRLLQELHQGQECNRDVQELPHLNNANYDELLSSTVGLTYLHGAGANNVVIESIARAAPLFVNRLPSTEEYLGPEYPLFYRHVGEIEAKLTRQDLCSAHSYLLEWREKQRRRFDVEVFADEVCEFAEQCQRRAMRRYSALRNLTLANLWGQFLRPTQARMRRAA